MLSGRCLRTALFQLFLIYVLAVSSLAQRGQDVPSFDTSCGNSSTLLNLVNYGQYCTNILSAWYRDNFEPYYYYYGSRHLDSPLRFQNTSQSWSEICRWSWYTANCFEGLLPDCDPGIGQELLNTPGLYILHRYNYESFDRYGSSDLSLIGFYRKSCSGKSLNSDIQSRVDNPDLDVNTSCIDQDRQEELGKCLSGLQEENKNRYAYITSTDVRDRINKVAEATVNCMYSVINRSPCNRATKRILYHVAKLQLPHYIDEKLLNLDESTTSDFSSLLRCTVGVYGDPHLRMCFEPGLTTCSALGPQILIANGWFLIAGTHEEIGRQSSTLPATSLRSIQIVFLSFDSASTVATYVGENGNLPSTFEGINATEVGTGNDRVTLTIRGSQREFVQHSTGMVLRLRQWSGNYFFTLRVAQGVIRKSYGLLATGCPEDQVIYRSQWRWSSPAARRKRAVTRETCERACNETITDDDTFRDTCAFDCYAVDDVTFGINITLPAVEDTVQIVTLDEEIRSRAVSPPKTTPSPNEGVTTSSYNVFTMSLISCLICLTLRSYST